MNIDKIINSIATDKEYYRLCKKLAPNFQDDLFQELMIIILEYDKDKLLKLYIENKIRFFVVKILMNQACSKTSPFYKKYRKVYDLSDLDWYDEYSAIPDELVDMTPKVIKSYSKENDNNWYRTELFLLYLKEGSIRKLSNKTGIPVMSICDSLKQFKTEIKSILNENFINNSI